MKQIILSALFLSLCGNVISGDAREKPEEGTDRGPDEPLTQCEEVESHLRDYEKQLQARTSAGATDEASLAAEREALERFRDTLRGRCG